VIHGVNTRGVARIEAGATVPVTVDYTKRVSGETISSCSANVAGSSPPTIVETRQSGMQVQAVVTGGVGRKHFTAADGTTTSTAHGLAVGDWIVFEPCDSSDFPSGLRDTNVNTDPYYVSAVTTDTFTVSEGEDCTAETIADGEGYWRRDYRFTLTAVTATGLRLVGVVRAQVF